MDTRAIKATACCNAWEFSVLANPWVYPAIIALCTLAREIVRSHSRHRDIAFLLKMTHDPTSLRYLVQLEEARRPWPTAQRQPPEDGPEPPATSMLAHPR